MTGYDQLYRTGRRPGPIQEDASWAHARHPFFVMADFGENARSKAQGKKEIAAVADRHRGPASDRRAL
jgi:transposase